MIMRSYAPKCILWRLGALAGEAPSIQIGRRRENGDFAAALSTRGDFG